MGFYFKKKKNLGDLETFQRRYFLLGYIYYFPLKAKALPWKINACLKEQQATVTSKNSILSKFWIDRRKSETLNISCYLDKLEHGCIIIFFHPLLSLRSLCRLRLINETENHFLWTLLFSMQCLDPLSCNFCVHINMKSVGWVQALVIFCSHAESDKTVKFKWTEMH